MDKLLEQFSVGLFFWQTLLFLALLFLLRKFAWKPILNAVNERESSIEEALQSAEKAKLAMAELKASNEELLNKARLERDEMLKEARNVKENIIAEAKAKSHEEAEKIIISAKESILLEKKAAITELKNQVAILSIEIAEKILKDELSSVDKQNMLIDNVVKDIHLN